MQRGNPPLPQGYNFYGDPGRGGPANYPQMQMGNHGMPPQPNYPGAPHIPPGYPPNYPPPMHYMPPPPPGYFQPQMGQRPGVPPQHMVPGAMPYMPMPQPGQPMPPGYPMMYPYPPPYGFPPGMMPPPGVMPGVPQSPTHKPSHQYNISPQPNKLPENMQQYQQSRFTQPNQEMNLNNQSNLYNRQNEMQNSRNNYQQQQQYQQPSGLAAAAAFGIEAEVPGMKSQSQMQRPSPNQQNIGPSGIAAAERYGISAKLPTDSNYQSQSQPNQQNTYINDSYKQKAIQNASKFGISAQLPGQYQQQQQPQGSRQIQLAARYGINAQLPGMPNKEANVLIASEYGIKAEIPGMNQLNQMQQSHGNQNKLSFGRVGGNQSQIPTLASFGITVQRPGREEPQMEEPQPERTHRKKKRKTSNLQLSPEELLEEVLYDYGYCLPDDFAYYLPDLIDYEYIYEILNTIEDEYLRLVTDINLDEKMTVITPEYLDAVIKHIKKPSQYPSPPDPEPPEILSRKKKHSHRHGSQHISVDKAKLLKLQKKEYASDYEYEEEEQRDQVRHRRNGKQSLIMSRGFNSTQDDYNDVEADDELGPQFVQQKEDNFEEEMINEENVEFENAPIVLEKEPEEKQEEEEKFEELGPAFVMDVSQKSKPEDFAASNKEIGKPEEPQQNPQQITQPVIVKEEVDFTPSNEELGKPEEPQQITQPVVVKEDFIPSNEEIGKPDEKLPQTEQVTQPIVVKENIEIVSPNEEIGKPEEISKEKEIIAATQTNEEFEKQDVKIENQPVDVSIPNENHDEPKEIEPQIEEKKEQNDIEQKPIEEIPEQKIIKQEIDDMQSEEEDLVNLDGEILAEEEDGAEFYEEEEQDDDFLGEEEFNEDIEYFQGSDGIIYDRFWPENGQILEQYSELFPIAYASQYPESFINSINAFLKAAPDFIEISMDPNFENTLQPVSYGDIQKAIEDKKNRELSKNISVKKSSDKSTKLSVKRNEEDITLPEKPKPEIIEKPKQEVIEKPKDIITEQVDKIDQPIFNDQPSVERIQKTNITGKIEVRKMTEEEKKLYQEDKDLTDIATPILNNEDENVILTFPNDKKSYIKSKDGKFIYEIPEGYENLPPDSLLEMLEDEQCGKFTPVSDIKGGDEFLINPDEFEMFPDEPPKPQSKPKPKEITIGQAPKSINLGGTNIVIERRKPGDPIPQDVVPVRFEDFEDDFDDGDFQVYQNPAYANNLDDIPPDMLQAMLNIPDDQNMYNTQVYETYPDAPIVVERNRNTKKK